MKIALDARTIFSPKPRGTGRNLLDAYRRIPALRPDWEIVLYHQRHVHDCAVPDWLPSTRDPDASRRKFSNLHTRRIDIPGDRFNLWLNLRLPRAARRDGVDLLHMPANAAPVRCPLPYVVTIHDLIPLVVDGECAPAERQAFRRRIRGALRNAAHIITVSQSTRDDLQREFDVSPERMTVIPWAPDGLMTANDPFVTERPARSRGDDSPHAAAIRAVRERYTLGESWLLNFSGESRRKNAAGLVDALALVSAALRARFQLVLVGCEPARVREHLTARAAQLGVLPQCRFLGFVAHEELRGLLRGAAGLVMPSLYEGFGLPILDAFACETPVLTSRVSSMPEVAGDAAIYCDPHERASIATGIEKLLDPAVAADLVARGVRRLSGFTWERTAAAMCRVFERAVKGAAAQGSGRAPTTRDLAKPEPVAGGVR